MSDAKAPPMPLLLGLFGFAGIGSAFLLPLLFAEGVASISGSSTNSDWHALPLLPALLLLAVGGIAAVARRQWARPVLVAYWVAGFPGTIAFLMLGGERFVPALAASVPWLILALVTALYLYRRQAVRRYFEVDTS